MDDFTALEDEFAEHFIDPVKVLYTNPNTDEDDVYVWGDLTQWSSCDAVEEVFGRRLTDEDAEQFADHLNQTSTE